MYVTPCYVFILMRFTDIGLLLLGSLLYADIIMAAEAVRAEAVVVTAIAEATPVVTGEVDEELNTGFSQTLTRAQFDTRITSLADTIAQQSGIQVRKSGGFGSFSSATLRGASSQQVLIFIDGLLLNGAAGGGFDLSTISLSDVERVEIYRGSTPASLGSASIGGAINIRTLKGGGEDKGNVTLGYGDFNTQKYSAFYTTKPGRLDYVLSAERFSSDNDFEFTNNNGTRLNPDDDSLEKRNNSDFKQNNILLKFGYDLDKDRRVDLMAQWFEKQQKIPVWNNHPAADTRFDVERLQSQLRLISNNVGSYGFNLSNTLEYLQTVEEYDDRNGSVGLGQQYDQNITTTIKFRSYTELPLDFQELSLIVELGEEKYQPTDLLGRNITIDSKRRSATIGIEDKLFVLNDKLLVNPAISVTRSNDSITLSEGVSRSYVNPRIGLKYFSNNWLTLKNNLGRYTRQPSFYELLGDRGVFIGNSELKSETGINFDIGFDIKLVNAFRNISNLSWQTSLFYSDVKDIIVRTFNSRGIGKSENIDQAEITGIENILQVDLVNKFSINFNATVQNMVNEQNNPTFKNKQLPGRFKWSYSTRIGYRHGKFSPFVEHLYQSGMYYDSPNILKAPNQNFVNVGASWKVDRATITFEINNVTDREVEDFRGFPQPGRAFFSTLKIDV